VLSLSELVWNVPGHKEAVGTVGAAKLLLTPVCPSAKLLGSGNLLSSQVETYQVRVIMALRSTSKALGTYQPMALQIG
jgi:hypothetical protein